MGGEVERIEIEGGEAGEQASTSGGGSSSAGVPYEAENEAGSSEAGTTTGAGSLRLEVEILTADAVDRVAYEIAHRVAAKAEAAKVRSITVVSPEIISYLRLHSALEAEVGALEAMTKRLAAAATPEAIETSDAAAFGQVAVEAAETARKAFKSASLALGMIAVSTSYSGRTKIARQTVLDAALGKHLAVKGIEVDLPERSLPASEPRGLFARMLDLRSTCMDLQNKGVNVDALSPIVGTIDNLLNLIFGTAGGTTSAPLAQQLMLADGISRGLTKGRAVLFADIAFSGGSYRTRKWIFNFLLGRDGLTYSGGAGVTYFLFRADDRTALDSDTLYFASPHGRFEDVGSREFRPSNLNR
ncbi:MAG TPA: hypothetical protein VF079_07490 [Sphingomicrobium sp.]